MCKDTTSKPKEVFVSATRYGFLSVSRQEGRDFDTKYIRADLAAPMIQWTGDNLREVVEFTGKSPKFDEYFKSWEEFEQYVHAHGDIFKMFYEDGSHYEVPVGAWIVKTPDGYNVPSVARFIHAKHEHLQDLQLL